MFTLICISFEIGHHLKWQKASIQYEEKYCTILKVKNVSTCPIVGMDYKPLNSECHTQINFVTHNCISIEFCHSLALALGGGANGKKL